MASDKTTDAGRLAYKARSIAYEANVHGHAISLAKWPIDPYYDSAGRCVARVDALLLIRNPPLTWKDTATIRRDCGGVLFDGCLIGKDIYTCIYI